MDRYRTAKQVKEELGAKPRRALVITTVIHESRAVQSHLSDIEVVTGSNGAMYQWGTFADPAGDWAVIHAICQAGNAGAAVSAGGAYNDFGNFHIQMFVGIAGSLKEDAPIGSVVIGDYVYNAHAAKVDDNGQYPRSHGHPAAAELLHAARMLIVDGTWTNLIKSPVQTKLPPVTEYPCDYPPVAQIKAIASGEQVVAGSKTPAFRNIRQSFSDAAAIEMEGWGAMTAAYEARTSAIVIRGISDMCAGKDHAADKQFQPIASAHAAAFAFSLLSIRSRASSQPASDDKFDERKEEAPSVAGSDTRVDFVVNFKGNLSEWSEEKINSVVDGLRKTTGDPELKLVRVEEGSVRFVINIREKDVSALTLSAVRMASGEARDRLLGAVTTQQLETAEEAREELKRASTNLLTWERTLPDGGWLERPEKQGIESRFQTEFSSTVLLGEPGSGKSALLAAIASDLTAAHAAVLAIKADLVSTEVHDERGLQTDLRLPALPGELIEQLAHLQPVYLIVDQLDALASQLDLRSDRLNVLLNLVRRVGGMPNVHILLSARTFEFNHDVRLRAIAAEAVTLRPPAWHEVNDKLTAAGIDANSWPSNAREVIRNPQALKTYLSLGTKDNQPFSKYQSMLEQLWRLKIVTAPDGQALASLASDIAGIMAEEEMIWLAASRFDTQAILLDRLESVGLIVRSDNGQSVAFSHQTVFDYVLARSFVRATGRLSTYVLERQNSLFVRAKLWSALRYLRDAEIASYEREFLEIWKCNELRHHLRLLLIEFLGEVRDPVAFERLCLEQVMRFDELRAAGLKSIIGSPGWFTNFMRTAIPKAMAGNDIEANQAVRILQKAWSFAASDVVRLLREQWLSTPAKDGFTWATLDACTNWTEPVEAISHTILSRTSINSWHVDHMASVLAVEQPEVAFRMVRAKLDFLLDKARAASPVGVRPTGGSSSEQVASRLVDATRKSFVAILESIEWNSLPAMAEEQPEEFLEILWPWFMAIFSELNARSRENTSDYLFAGLYDVDVRLEGESNGRVERTEQPLLSSVRLAVEHVAKENHSYFAKWAQLNGDVELMAVQRFIAHGFRSAAQIYAPISLNWLFQDSRRLQLGNIHGQRQTTAALIAAVSPFWSNEDVSEFESKVLAYQPKTPAHVIDAQGRKYFSQFIRATRAHLLTAVPIDRLSQTSKELLAVEKRAMGNDFDLGIHTSGAGFIGSPMEAQSMAKAKDRDILKMFEEVPDNTDWDHPTHWMRGGNIQLSRAFAEFAKAEPLRAIRIMEQFKPAAQERAAGYALDSMSEVGDHDRDLQDALLDLHQRGFGVEEFRTSAAHALEKMAKRATSIDESLVRMLTEWLGGSAKNAELTEQDEELTMVHARKQPESEDARQDSVLWGYGGVGILPGGNYPILSALVSILLHGEEGRDRLFAILNDHLPREQDARVWQALLLSLANAGGSTPLVVSTFLRKLFARYPSLLETHEAIHLLAYAQRWDDKLVHELIAPWRNTDNQMLRQAQGELVGLISIVKPTDLWHTMRNQLLEHGSPEAKIGLAYAGAHLWTDSQFHVAAGQLLVRLITDADKTRMSAILDVFRLCSDLDPDPATLDLVRALAAPGVDLSAAPSTFIVEKLQSLLPHAADEVAEIALKLVRGWRRDLGNIQSVTAIAAPQLTDLSITLHRLGGASRERGVTIFETLIDIDAHGACETLAEIDGRFGVHQVDSSRRRIARKRTAKPK